MRHLPITLAAMLAATAAPAQEDVAIPYLDPGAVSLGQSLYADHCASCHGEKLEGEPDWMGVKPDGLRPAPPHDETGHTWHHPDAQLFDLTKHGLTAVMARRGMQYDSAMIGFGDVMTDAEILAVLAYIKSTWPEDVIEMHNKINAAQQ